MIKIPEATSKQFPAQNANNIQYPDQALKKNLLYQTTNQSYGHKMPK